MTAYLISATLLWAFSLMLYELLFRRLRLHGENRAFLLISLAAGLLLPLLSIQVAPVAALIRNPVVQTTELRRQLLAQVSGQDGEVAQALNWWLMVWAAGACLMLMLLMRQVIVLIRIYRSADKTRQEGYTHAATTHIHSPFSFFRCIFIPSSADYNPQELIMILRHEQQHARLLHSADVLFLQLLRVVFWFHPLVHLFYARVRLVHEYQADAVEENNALGYGRFLIEQAMPGSTPSFAHSIFRSPLKTRIAMLLKTSTATRLRYLAALLLLPVFFLCCAYGMAPKKRELKGDKIYFNGDVITIAFANYQAPDTSIINDPATGKEVITVHVASPFPAALNGERLLNPDSYPTTLSGSRDIAAAVFEQMRPLLDNLESGKYSIYLTPIVVDKTGRIRYFECEKIFKQNSSYLPEGQIQNAPLLKKSTEFENRTAGNTGVPPSPLPNYFAVDESMQSAILARLDELLLYEIRLKPALLNGIPVACTTNWYNDPSFDFEVKEHRASRIVERDDPRYSE